MPRNPDCELCELCLSSKHVCIWGDGDGKAFVVGEAPGREEGRTGKPFMGESGQLLRYHLGRRGLADAYITNAAKCRPPDNRKPEPRELAACRPYLFEEIEDRNPDAILLLGATAMRTLIGKTKITSMNGQVVEKAGRKYVCCFHPSYIKRDPSKLPQFEMALDRYVSVLDGTYDERLPTWRVVDLDSFDDFIHEWGIAEKISFDIETNGLKWWLEETKIHCIIFGMTPGTSWVLPLTYRSVLPFEQQKELLQYLASNTANKTMVSQNGKFDNLMLKAKYGVKFRNDFDTMLAHHLIDENSRHDLKLLSRTYLGAPDYDIQLKDKIEPKSWRKLFSYGASDGQYTVELADRFDEMLDEEDRWLFDNLVMPAARVLEEVEENGLYVDLEMMERVEREQRALMEETLRELSRMAGREINWNTPKEIAGVLYGDLGLTPTVLTPKGFPSTSEQALVDLNHPISKQLEKYRTHQKFLSTYIDGWKEFMYGPHLYLSFKIHGAVTGRWSSRLHQVPRDGTIRNIITAPPGWTFVQMDLSQAELRVIAIVARDPVMLDIFKRGGDIHWQVLMAIIENGGGEYAAPLMKTAKEFLGSKRKISFADALDVVSNMDPKSAIEIWDGWKEGRKKAKGTSFGYSYGQSALGFIDYAKAKYGFTPTLEESTAMRNAYFTKFYRLPDWHERQKKLVRQDGMVKNLLGRKRHLPGIYSKDRSVVAECERQAINSPIQGFIGDYKACILIELHETLSRTNFRICGEVHDSILMWIRTEQLESILPRVKRIAENPQLASHLKFPIKLTVDFEVGRWGGGKTWKPTED